MKTFTHYTEMRSIRRKHIFCDTKRASLGRLPACTRGNDRTAKQVSLRLVDTDSTAMWSANRESSQHLVSEWPNNTTLLNATIHSIAAISIFDKVLEISCELACVLRSYATIFAEAGATPAFYSLDRNAVL